MLRLRARSWDDGIPADQIECRRFVDIFHCNKMSITILENNIIRITHFAGGGP
jgi:hypothetical protein